jgi:hypothetical protein
VFLKEHLPLVTLGTSGGAFWAFLPHKRMDGNHFSRSAVDFALFGEGRPPFLHSLRNVPSGTHGGFAFKEKGRYLPASAKLYGHFEPYLFEDA